MPPDVITFGCRLNAYESEVMRGHAAAAGLEDAVVINTCAVTAEAVRQARQAIRKLRRERPQARIVVTGCAAQTEPETFASMPEVDRVLGNAEKLDAAAWTVSAEPFGLDAEEKVSVNDIMAVRETALHLIDGIEGRARAFVQVQNGCDHRCTFCIIPYGRGNSRSVPMGAVVAQVRKLVEAGCHEVVLTGVDITSYGIGLPGAPTLGKLVKQILKFAPELPRLRLSSIDSVEADRDLLDVIAEEPRLMPHLHLSLQAGDDLVLKRMKRRHSRADAIRFCQDVRRLRPDMAFGGDIIAGFPTETEAMFARSLDLVDDCGLTHLHVFPFSPRRGTPAARMPQVARAVVKERARRLREKGEAALRTHLERAIGTRRSVLVECAEGGIATGRTEHFAPVLLNAPAEPGTVLVVAIIGHDGRRLLAQGVAP
jgi:threonylcarbamoyladenosine tRNA methylthiotransferase MtaB